MERGLFETEFPDLELYRRGKVRDIYDLGDQLLMVATDRISAFDVIMPNPVPDKGKILNRISLFWFGVMQSIIDNHVITSHVEDYPERCRQYRDMLNSRSMLVKKTRPLPVECVVRGYISGSGWKAYQETGEICGIQLPTGLRESDPLPEAIFTPSTKADFGDHDINISFDAVVEKIGRKTADQIHALSLAIYRKGAAIAAEKDIIIADTKFEFGLDDDDNLLLIDEVLTPDSSRFWPKGNYQPGGPQQSYDKQYLRDYLLSLDWDKSPPAPKLPEAVISNTRKKYIDALNSIVGSAHEF